MTTWPKRREGVALGWLVMLLVLQGLRAAELHVRWDLGVRSSHTYRPVEAISVQPSYLVRSHEPVSKNGNDEAGGKSGDSFVIVHHNYYVLLIDISETKHVDDQHD